MGYGSWSSRKLEEFNPESDSVTEYVEHASIYFAANEVPADKKVPVFSVL